MDRLANALDKLYRAQTTTTPWATFKAPDFNGKEDVETFIQDFQEVAEANEWSNTAAFLHIRMHPQDDTRGCVNHSTFRAGHLKHKFSA